MTSSPREILNKVMYEAIDYGNVNVTPDFIKELDIFEETVLDADGLDFETRIEVRNRLEALRQTMNLALAAREWGKDARPHSDDALDDEDVEVQLPVLTHPDFYRFLFDAVEVYENELTVD